MDCHVSANVREPNTRCFYRIDDFTTFIGDFIELPICINLKILSNRCVDPINKMINLTIWKVYVLITKHDLIKFTIWQSC